MRRNGTRRRPEQIRAFARLDLSPKHSTTGRLISLHRGRAEMGYLKSGLFWLVGVPLPFILLLALFLHPG
jgi:hypothetical protein